MFEPTAEQLDNEESIVWLEDVSGLRYVRQWTDEFCPFRARRPRFTLDGRMVGYAILREDAKGPQSYRFPRRIFWLKAYDFPSAGPYKRGGSPVEGVDPSSVKAGLAGLHP